MKTLLFLALLVPGTAAAEELYPALPGVEYFCTDNRGDRVEIGQIACFTASCQTWMARCEMGANNRMAMWRKLQDGCPGVTLIERLQRVRGNA